MPSTMTILDIANRAAVKLGEKQITSLTEDSKFARAMNNIVEPVRDRFLRENDWNSATVRATLAVSTTIPAWGYAHQFALPSDFLKMLEVRNPTATTATFNSYTNTPRNTEYRIEGDYIMANEASTLQIRYVKRLTDASRYDSMMGEALATLFAFEASYSITSDKELRAELKREYKDQILMAGRADGFDDPMEQFPEDDWVVARHEV
jgi:hypothetical protein